MQTYSCGCCGNPIYFENVMCQRCGSTLGFLPDVLAMAAVEPVGDNLWRPVGRYQERLYYLCPNYQFQHVCNWLVAVEDINRNEPYCMACRLNHTIPDLRITNNKSLWYKLEVEKRHLIYSMLRLGLPVNPQTVDPNGLAFDFLADVPTFSERGRVMTGHLRGLITLNIAEADPVVREQMRTRMDEQYRTILGHFRHESGHYYWDRLIRHSQWLNAYRDLFGNELRDYSQALEQYYQNGPALHWNRQFISAYASSHPWEDWAETWAHYLHIIDTLETAGQYGMQLQVPNADLQSAAKINALQTLRPYEQLDFGSLVDSWIPLTSALNAINRSMGYELLYPFILNPKVVEKMCFIHHVVYDYRQAIQGFGNKR